MKPEENRKPEYNVDSFFYERWSPRSYEPIEIPDSELMSLFEAAKWAPSCFNEQPWLFLYAKRNTVNWDLFLSFLVDANKVWAVNASVLIVLLSKKTFSRNGKPNDSHTLDVGAAWQNLALQSHLKAWAAHGMAGFDRDRAFNELGVTQDYKVEMMIAVGKEASREKLSEDLQTKEVLSLRKKVSEIAKEGKFS